MITHCIFDCDGVILDTESLYFKVYDEYTQRYGKQFSIDMQIKMMGKNPDEAGKLFLKETGLKVDFQTYTKEINALLERALSECDVFAGAMKLIYHLYKFSIPIAVATGSDKSHFEMKIKRHQELFSLFDHIVLSDDVELKRLKPAPDIYLLAIKRFKVAPAKKENILVFEDSLNGLLSALAAGTRTVFVPSVPLEYLDPSIVKKADVVLKSLNDFEPELFGLPPYNPCREESEIA